MFAWATVKTHFPLTIPITNLFKLLDSSFAEVMSFVKEIAMYHLRITSLETINRQINCLYKLRTAVVPEWILDVMFQKAR